MRVRICTSHGAADTGVVIGCIYLGSNLAQPPVTVVQAHLSSTYSATAYSTSALYCIRPSDCILPSTSPASCSGVAVMSRRASQFVYTRSASLRIMLAAYCPNNPSGAGKTMAPPLPHAASGAYPAQHRPDEKVERRKT